MAKKTVYFSDELNDDFAATHGKIKVKPLSENYKYIRKNPLWQLIAVILYRLVATPVAFAFTRGFFGLRIKNKRALRKIRGGYFLYGNHTQSVADAFIPSMLSFPKKANIVCFPDAVSLPVVRVLVPMFGGMPLPDAKRGKVNMMTAMKKKTRRQAVTVYPEAHIWPYYNKIRPFSDASFSYPHRFGVPAVGFVVTYRARKRLKNLPPKITVTLSDPIYPSEVKNRTELRNKIYEFMTKTAESEKSFEYIKYVKRTDENEHNDSMRRFGGSE